MSERSRKIASAKTSWPVTVKHPQGEMDGLITLVNPNGVLILCSRPLKLNEVCWMTINAPNRSLEAKGLVVWSNIYGRDDEITPRGNRVRFLKISSQDRMFIASELEGQGVKKDNS
jgi:hypothetical protein